MISLKRSFSIVSVILKSADLNPVFKPHHANPKGTAKSFSKNLPQSKKQLKPWEKKNLSKDEFFMRKYGNITPEQRKALDEKVARQRRHREMRIAHEKALRDKEREERENARQMARMSKKVHHLQEVLDCLKEMTLSLITFLVLMLLRLR